MPESADTKYPEATTDTAESAGKLRIPTGPYARHILLCADQDEAQMRPLAK